MRIRTSGVAAVLAFALLATSATADTPRTQIEIYRITSGQHEAFLRFIALCDQANREAGLQPRQLYVHQDGASWDFIILQPADITSEQSTALDAAFKRLKIPQGAKFFLTIRQFIAEHTDTTASGPTTAAEWLSRLER